MSDPITRDDFDRLEGKVDKIADYVWRGNSRDPLTVRMDRIERAQDSDVRRRTWFSRTIVGAALTSTVAAMAAWMGGR